MTRFLLWAAIIYRIKKTTANINIGRAFYRTVDSAKKKTRKYVLRVLSYEFNACLD